MVRTFDVWTGIPSLGMCLVLPLFVAGPATADESVFFAGKTVTISIGTDVGGGFDLYARTVAQVLGKHIPGNPRVIPENRPGAGGRVAANWLYNVAPKDGTSIGHIGPWLATEPLMGVQGVQFDATKFHWLINANRETSSCAFFTGPGRNPPANLDDLKAREATVGSLGPFTAMTADARALNAIYGTKIKVFEGYKGSRDALLAAERGEVDGICGLWASTIKSSFSEYARSGRLRPAVQMGLASHPEFGNVENVLLRSMPDADRLAVEVMFGQLDIGRPFVLPPSVPATRVAAMRKAFSDAMADPELIETAGKRGLEIRPLEGEKVQAFVEKLYATPQPVVARVRSILGY